MLGAKVVLGWYVVNCVVGCGCCWESCSWVDGPIEGASRLVIANCYWVVEGCVPWAAAITAVLFVDSCITV